MRVENYGRWPVRINLRLSRETASVYEEFAELTGAEVTSVLRLFADEAAPHVAHLSAAIRAERSGNSTLGAEIVDRMADTFVAESHLHKSRAEELREEVEAKRERAGASR